MKKVPEPISILVPSKERPDLLDQLLTSMAKHLRVPHEVVLVETGQSNFEELNIVYDRVTVREYLPGGTFAQATNLAAKLAIYDHFWLCNNDIILTNDPWVGKAYLGDAIIGARLLYPDGLVQHGGVGFDQDGAPYNLWRLAPAEHPEVIKRRVLPAVTFACALIPRAVWEEVGGLDEEYTNAFEDVDFCLKARELGHTVIYDPSVCAVHLEGQSAGRHDGIEASWRHFQDSWLATNRIRYALGVWPFSAVRG